MKNGIYIFLVLVVTTSVARTQVTITNGHHTVEISGSISTYYNYRVLKPNEFDRKKDRFRLRDAQLQIEGRYKNLVEYEFQCDFADIAAGSAGSIDAENPGLMDAYVIYKGLPVDIRFGYGKLPYSRSSLVPFLYSPYWQRVEMVRGDIFSRRDIGITLEKSMWKQRINLFAGIYNGLGEVSLRGDNDASGKPEFVSRAEFAWPSRYRYRDIDDRVSPIPMFVIGVNGRYMDKRQMNGTSLPAFSAGEYNIKVADGIKKGYGFDISAQYMGFSAQFEMHQFFISPRTQMSALLMGTPEEHNKGYVRAGGYYGQINYFSKPIRSIVSLRFEELNLNDLADGQLRRFSAAIAYQVKGFDMMIKAQYFRVLSEEVLIDPLKWSEQFRIGIQYMFK